MTNPHDPNNRGDNDNDRTRQFDPVDPPNSRTGGYPAPRSPRDWDQTSQTGNTAYSSYSDRGTPAAGNAGYGSTAGYDSNDYGQGYPDDSGQGDSPVTHYEKVSADLDEALEENDRLKTYKAVALIAAPAAVLLGILTVILLMTEPSPAETVVTGPDGAPTTTTVPAETTTATRTVENEVTETQTATKTETATETAVETVTETPEAATTTVTTTVPTTE